MNLLNKLIFSRLSRVVLFLALSPAICQAITVGRNGGRDVEMKALVYSHSLYTQYSFCLKNDCHLEQPYLDVIKNNLTKWQQQNTSFAVKLIDENIYYTKKESTLIFNLNKFYLANSEPKSDQTLAKIVFASLISLELNLNTTQIDHLLASINLLDFTTSKYYTLNISKADAKIIVFTSTLKTDANIANSFIYIKNSEDFEPLNAQISEKLTTTSWQVKNCQLDEALLTCEVIFNENEILFSAILNLTFEANIKNNDLIYLKSINLTYKRKIN